MLFIWKLIYPYCNTFFSFHSKNRCSFINKKLFSQLLDKQLSLYKYIPARIFNFCKALMKRMGKTRLMYRERKFQRNLQKTTAKKQVNTRWWHSNIYMQLICIKFFIRRGSKISFQAPRFLWWLESVAASRCFLSIAFVYLPRTL